MVVLKQGLQLQDNSIPATQLKTPLVTTKTPSGSRSQKQAQHHHESFAVKYVLSASAATCSELVTYPLDLTKTRLQVQGEMAAASVRNFGHFSSVYYLNPHSSPGALPQRGMLFTAIGVIREEGFFKLWQGAPPAVYRHIIYTGVRMSLYEYIREELPGKNPDGTIPIWKGVLGGMVSGMIGQFLASPNDLVKVQLQTEGRRRLQGLEPRVYGVVHAFKKNISEGN